MKHLFPKFIIMAGLAVLLTAITLQRLQAHSGKARLHLIVDTDGAADDLRTLLMQLANREAEVLAIVTSEGALSPSTTALKADDLCADLYPYARKIAATHRTPPLKRLIDRHHIEAWDDLVAVYLYAPQLFDVRRISTTVSYCTLRADALPDARRQIIRILKGRPDAETRVFYGFPTREELYSEEVRPIISVALSKYGESEWRAGVLTNELHGHLGIYATVGFKMGIRAREYFNIGVDDISVTSYAGTRPPVSCMNDGLQVAAGSTIGYWLDFDRHNIFDMEVVK